MPTHQSQSSGAKAQPLDAGRVQLAHALEQLQAEVAALRGERALLLQSLEYHERDRQLLAFEIHDGIIQDMTASLMFLEAGSDNAAFASPEHAERFARGVNVLRGAVAEARRLIQGLIPVQLDERGLVASLEKLIDKYRDERGLAVEFAADVQLCHLVPAVEMILLRIVQESLSNVWKHSQTASATVSLTQRGDNLEVVIADQGVGFDPSQVKRGRFGLTGIRERAKLIGGQTQIDSQPGHGTRVVVNLQLRQPLVVGS